MAPPPSPPPTVRKRRRKKRSAGWRSWIKTDTERSLIAITVLVLGTVAIIAAMGILTRKVLDARRNQSRPTVANTHPPEFVQPFVCDLKAGFRSGDLRTFIKNDGNAGAKDVFQTLALHLVPEQKVNIPEFDEIPLGDCKIRPRRSSEAYTLNIGQETGPQMPQPAVTLPPLLEGEVTRLYAVSCIYYSSGSGDPHATCDTYRFRLATGASIFMCDAAPKAGTFDKIPVSTCGN